MLIEVGHTNAVDGPVVTQVGVSDETNEDGSYVVSYIVGTDAQEMRDHLFDNPGIVTHLPGNTAVLEVNVIRGCIESKVTWVDVAPGARSDEEAADYERFLSEFFKCERGHPEDHEATHWTLHNGEVFSPGNAPAEEG